jgi:hypothetical protein
MLKATATHSSSPITKLHATVAPMPPPPPPPAAAPGDQNVSCGCHHWPVVVAWDAPPGGRTYEPSVLILPSAAQRATLAMPKGAILRLSLAMQQGRPKWQGSRDRW